MHIRVRVGIVRTDSLACHNFRLKILRPHCAALTIIGNITKNACHTASTK